ncbi:unnamed protein product [Strongylus vulgaris]|uniref:Uncharacterized protein n=1 Tax=Strongylus vulgaris TaxID=40348 RepID=A0A3P7KZB3_STRVU|nr:unnamed protein product [Strongylus vulgaris]
MMLLLALANGMTSAKKAFQERKSKPANSTIKCYSRKDLIAIQNSVPKEAWIPYVRAQWDTDEEPFQLNQYLRCSFEEQLRRKREIERKQRNEVMKSRQKTQMEKPKLRAFSRTGSSTPVEEDSFEMFCSRISNHFTQLKSTKDANILRIGSVVSIRMFMTMSSSCSK